MKQLAAEHVCFGTSVLQVGFKSRITTRIDITDIVFSVAGGRGNWNSSGCTTVYNETSNVATCVCSHLTNFAVLVVSSANPLYTNLPTFVSSKIPFFFLFSGHIGSC